MDWRSLGSVRALAKAELHAHLAGCIPPRAAQELLRELQIDLPEGFDLEHDLSIDTPVPSRNDARMPHCLRWGGMASLVRGFGGQIPPT
jgi:hypothetical protein